jgi:large subunit ribosomal protein L11
MESRKRGGNEKKELKVRKRTFPIQQKRRRRKKKGKKMKKKAKAKIRLTLLANKAAPSPILGQALGQYGINIMEFCKNFNGKTKNIKENTLIPTKIMLYSKETYEIIIKTPTTTNIIKQITNIEKGSKMTKKENIEGYIKLKEIYHIAILKKCDKILNHIKIKEICKSIIGTVKSMGIGLRHP